MLLHNVLSRLTSLSSRTKLDTDLANPPQDSDSWYNRCIWLYSVMRKRIRVSKRLAPLWISTFGLLKRVISGEVYRLDPNFPDSQQESNQLLPAQNRFVTWAFHEAQVNQDKRVNTPEQTFEKLWLRFKPEVMQFRLQQGHDYKWGRFLEKVKGRNPARMTLEEQGEFIKHAPDWAFQGLFNTDRRSIVEKLSAQLRYNPGSDFYEYDRLPTGGPLAEHMPEALVMTYVPRMKENLLANRFNYDKFMEFILRHCDPKGYKRFFKMGTVYRIGGNRTGRKWYAASLSLEGIKGFIKNWGESEKYLPAQVNSGAVRYFDLLAYDNLIRAKLGKGVMQDAEQEVLTDNVAALKTVTTITKDDVWNS